MGKTAAWAFISTAPSEQTEVSVLTGRHDRVGWEAKQEMRPCAQLVAKRK